MTFANAIRALWLSGGLAIALVAARKPLTSVRPLRPADVAPASFFTGEFARGAVHPSTTEGVLPPGTETIGSWIESDGAEGRAETVWTHVPLLAESIRVCVAGFPQHAGCRLWAEIRRRDGSISHVGCTLANPQDHWAAWDFVVPSGTEALRLVGEDRAADFQGWFGFSEPIMRPRRIAGSLLEFAQVFATFALALTLVWLPGLIGVRWVERPEIRLAVQLGAGPLALVAIAIAAWFAEESFRPHFSASSSSSCGGWRSGCQFGGNHLCPI